MRFWPALLAGVVFGFASLGLAAGEKSPGGSLKEKTEDPVKRVKELEDSLALALTEADYFHQQWVELKLKDEALGIDALTADEKALNEKLVRLVGELYQSEKRRLASEKALQGLIDAGRRLHEAGLLEQSQRRAEYEVSVRQARQVLQGDAADLIRVARDKVTGTVTSVNEELRVAVVNFGKTQQAEVGMPYRILRGEKVIGRCRLIEVHAYLSAARIESVIEKEKVQPGDRVLLETIK